MLSFALSQSFSKRVVGVSEKDLGLFYWWVAPSFEKLQGSFEHPEENLKNTEKAHAAKQAQHTAWKNKLHVKLHDKLHL